MLIIAQDTGMRPSEIYRMRIENLDFETRQVWNPFGKTTKSRRFVPMSKRMASVLTARCIGQHEGWVFPSARSKSGHITTIAKGFRTLRERAGLSMGHVDLKSMEPYQHHDLASLRAAINQRNQSPSPSTPQFGHILGHIGQSETDEGASIETSHPLLTTT